MKKNIFLPIYFLLLFLELNLLANNINNEKIISYQKFIPAKYENLEKYIKQKISSKSYNELVRNFNNIKDAEFFKIKYLSDGLKISGFIIKPKKNKKKCPIVIYNRGGFGEDGKLDFFSLLELYYLAKNGYVVLASQYRGNDGSEGKDHCGGEDVNDVLNLIKASCKLDYVDTNNIFMIGFSRGGMMTYLAIKNNAPINAAIVIAGLSDLFMFAKMHPDAEKIILNKIKVEDKAKEYKERSATCWTDKINKPILLIHNLHDNIVSVEHSKSICSLLQKNNVKYLLRIYNGKRHTLDEFRDNIREDILNWLNLHRVKN